MTELVLAVGIAVGLACDVATIVALQRRTDHRFSKDAERHPSTGVIPVAVKQRPSC